MSGMPEDVTPIRQQYLDIKRQYPDAIVFFRLGDFYETFDQDAELAARELDIVLTSRNVAKGTRVPMAGIPYHAVENYLARLIEKGYHVAICEQVGEVPRKGLVRREVVRVVTPGTVVEPGLLSGNRNNYLACALVIDNDAGVAYADITTGEFKVTQFSGPDVLSELRAELARLSPAELLLPESMSAATGLTGHITLWPDWRFESGRNQETLQRLFQTASLDGYGLRNRPFAVRAAGALVQYIQETQPQAVKLLLGLSTYTLDEFMNLDSATRRNLELTETIRGGGAKGSLLHVLDHTVTPMGGRLLRQWVSKPLLDIAAIEKRQNGVACLLEDGILRAELFRLFTGLPDMERAINLIVSGHAGPRTLTSLRQALRCLPDIKAAIPADCAPLQALVANLDLCSTELDLLERAIADEPPATLQHTGVIRPGFSAELDGVIEASSHARDWIANLEAVERERSGIKNLKVGYNKVFGYYLEVSRANSQHVPDDYIRKQTLVNAERYITPEMKEYEALVLNADERIREIEGRIFQQVCKELAASSQKILDAARTLAELDTLASLAEAAALGNYVRPALLPDQTLEIHDGRHPVVEQSPLGKRFVPNDCVFGEGEIVRVITGPNMSGKSTFLRQTALIVLMAQIGSFVPASSARIGLVDRIFTRIGAEDEISAGQSTFMVEMVQTAEILNNATPRSLLILDEIGRGTSTYDGLSIAWAVVEYIHNHPKLRSRTLFATHFHELTQLQDLLPGVRNYNVAVSEADGQVVFLHKIVPGGADRSYGIHVAQLAGLPRAIIQRANEILRQLEASSGKAVKIEPEGARQLALFPETNPLLEELHNLDLNALSPIEALNLLYQWQRRFDQS